MAGSVAAALAGEPARLVGVALVLPSARRVFGSVGGIHGTTLVRGTYSKADARQLIRLWPALLAVAASDPAQQFRAIVVGKDEAVHLAAPTGPAAAQILDELLDLMEAGLRTPLPLYSRTSHAYAKCRREGKRLDLSLGTAGRSWRPDKFDGDCDAAEAVVLFGRKVPIATLSERCPAAGGGLVARRADAVRAAQPPAVGPDPRRRRARDGRAGGGAQGGAPS